MADLIKALDIPVILVVGMRLGCINHTILTYKAIISSQITIKAWVANCIDPYMEALEENINTIQELLNIPCIAAVPFGQKPENILSIDSLLL